MLRQLLGPSTQREVTLPKVLVGRMPFDFVLFVFLPGDTRVMGVGI